jgi:hypothetical protein
MPIANGMHSLIRVIGKAYAITRCNGIAHPLSTLRPGLLAAGWPRDHIQARPQKAIGYHDQ